MKAMIDTNIVMDFLCKRPMFFENSNRIFKLCIENKLTGVLAGHTIPTIFYLLRKDVPSSKERCEILLNLCEIFEIGEITKNVIVNALEDSSFDDFEDSLQNTCAMEKAVDYIITRNKKDFLESKITLYTPEEFLTL